jgi:hypothetical protein
MQALMREAHTIKPELDMLTDPFLPKTLSCLLLPPLAPIIIEYAAPFSQNACLSDLITKHIKKITPKNKK